MGLASSTRKRIVRKKRGRETGWGRKIEGTKGGDREKERGDNKI